MIATMDESVRQYDINGFILIDNNPISREGVFPYSGGQIGAPEKDRIYQVYRPGSELSDEETIASFRLCPLVDDHTMLGAGLTPAEEKGVEGTTGDNVRFENGVLTANLKIFSTELAQKIKSGKTELSCGYRCVYEFTPGEWNGQRYDAIQRQIRGNHLALVDEGRMGPSVAILDQMTFTVDAREQRQTMDEELKKMLEAFASRFEAIEAALAKLAGAEAKEAEVSDEDPTAKAADAEADPAAAAKDEDPTAKAADAEADPAAAAKDEDPAKAMDALSKEVKALTAKLAARPVMDEGTVIALLKKKATLAETLSKHIGTFDHSAMTYDQVVNYGVKQLGLRAPKGGEAIALDAALQVRSVAQPFTTATDAAPTNARKQVLEYINGGK